MLSVDSEPWDCVHDIPEFGESWQGWLTEQECRDLIEKIFKLDGLGHPDYIQSHYTYEYERGWELPLHLLRIIDDLNKSRSIHSRPIPSPYSLTA
jgi:hypothetical protein